MSKARTRRELWHGIDIGKWDPARMCALFLVYGSDAESEADRDQYARLVMIQVTANFKRQEWMPGLRKIGMDVEAAASDLVQHVLRKTPRARAKMEHPCEKVILGYINRMIINRMLSLIRHHQRLQRHRQTQDSGKSDDTILGRMVSPAAPADCGWLASYLREREDEVCRPIPGNIFDIVTLYRYLSRRLAREGEFTSYDALPDRLREKINVDTQYLRVTRSLRRCAAAAAADAIG